MPEMPQARTMQHLSLGARKSAECTIGAALQVIGACGQIGCSQRFIYAADTIVPLGVRVRVVVTLVMLAREIVTGQTQEMRSILNAQYATSAFINKGTRASAPRACRCLCKANVWQTDVFVGVRCQSCQQRVWCRQASLLLD